MSFKPRAVFISHAGLPSGLTSAGDFADYMTDVDRELEALQASWDAYCKAQAPDAQDVARYQNTVESLEDLKQEADIFRAAAAE